MGLLFPRVFIMSFFRCFPDKRIPLYIKFIS